MGIPLAYLAQGRLFYRDGPASRLVDSAFGQDVINRALQRQAKNEWKTAGESDSGMYSRQALWGVPSQNSGSVNVRITAVAPGRSEHELLYVVCTDTVSGLFAYNLQTGKETRIFHKEALYLSDFAKFDDDMIACCQRMPNGTASIALIKGNDVIDITEGDSVDESPSWIPGAGKQLLYQCAGVARNSQGAMVGVGHAHIQRLDLSTGSLSTVLENDEFDFLSPKMNAARDLFFIRRPYEAPFQRSYSPGKILLDTVLFPFRLARAVFDFLNIFSLLVSKKPLTTATGPKLGGPDEKVLFLRGRLIDTEKAMQEKSGDEEIPSLVPKSWQLIRRSADGQEQIIAESVLSFDLVEDSIIYSTGVAVYQIKNNTRSMLFRDKLVDTVIALPPRLDEQPKNLSTDFD